MADRHCRAVRPSVGSYVVDRDRALRSGVTTEIVNLVIESHVSTSLCCRQRGAGGPNVGSDIVDGVLGNVRAVKAAGDVYLAIPIGALNVLLGSRHVGELRPGLRRRSPPPEVVIVTATRITTAVHVDICSIGASTGTIASRRARRGGLPGPWGAAATLRKQWRWQILDHFGAACQRGHPICRKTRELFLDQPRRGKVRVGANGMGRGNGRA